MGDYLIWWPLKASLDLRLIEQAVVFSSHDIGQSRCVQICHHGIIPILAIQSQDGLTQGDVLTGEVSSNDGYRTQQIASVIPIARVAKCPHPLMGMGLQNRGPRANNLSPLVSCVSRCTDRIQTTRTRREIWSCGQSSLDWYLSCGIKV